MKVYTLPRDVLGKVFCKLKAHATVEGLAGTARKEKGEGGVGGLQPYASRAQLKHIWDVGNNQYAHAASSAVELSK